MFSKKSVNMSVTCFQQDRSNGIWPLLHTAQASKQTSGDPSGQTRDYRGITLLNKFTTALLYKYMESSVTMARIVARLSGISSGIRPLILGRLPPGPGRRVPGQNLLLTFFNVTVTE